RSRIRLPRSVSSTWSGVPPTIDLSRGRVRSEEEQHQRRARQHSPLASHEAAWGAALDAAPCVSHVPGAAYGTREAMRQWASITARAMGTTQKDTRILTRFGPAGLWNAALSMSMAEGDVLGVKIPAAGRPVV